MPQKKLLIVESDPNLASQLENGLNDDFDIIIALSGSDGLNLAKSNKPDVIILDFILPKMNGFQLTTELKKDATFNETSIFLLTENDEVGNKFIDQFKITDFYTKPYKAEAIVSSIKAKLGLGGGEVSGTGADDLTPEEDSLEFLEQIFSEVSEEGETVEPTATEIPFTEEKTGKEEVTEVLNLDDDEPGDTEVTLIDLGDKPAVTPAASLDDDDDDDDAFDAGLEEFNPEDLGVLDEIFSEVDDLLPSDDAPAPTPTPEPAQPVIAEAQPAPVTPGLTAKTQPEVKAEIPPEPTPIVEELETVGELDDSETSIEDLIQEVTKGEDTILELESEPVAMPVEEELKEDTVVTKLPESDDDSKDFLESVLAEAAALVEEPAEPVSTEAQPVPVTPGLTEDAQPEVTPEPEVAGVTAEDEGSIEDMLGEIMDGVIEEPAEPVSTEAEPVSTEVQPEAVTPGLTEEAQPVTPGLTAEPEPVAETVTPVEEEPAQPANTGLDSRTRTGTSCSCGRRN